jgi:hypothetical protein
MSATATSFRKRVFYRYCVVFRPDSSPRREVLIRMIDQVRDAIRVLFASTIVQGCEVADESLARCLNGRAAVRRQRTGR